MLRLSDYAVLEYRWNKHICKFFY